MAGDLTRGASEMQMVEHFVGIAFVAAWRANRMEHTGAIVPTTPQQVAVALRESVTTAVRGKDAVVDLAIATLLGGGHLLVEDLPGTGKTLLARSIAAASGASFGRVQCTPDLLPTDITGTSVFRPDSGDWQFRPGPIFANVVLVDEVNRASPRTQSALLQPMEERQLTVDG